MEFRLHTIILHHSLPPPTNTHCFFCNALYSRSTSNHHYISPSSLQLSGHIPAQQHCLVVFSCPRPGTSSLRHQGWCPDTHLDESSTNRKHNTMDPSDMTSVPNTQNIISYRNPNILCNLGPVLNLGNMHTLTTPVHQAIL